MIFKKPLSKQKRILLIITSVLLVTIVIIGFFVNTILEKKVAELLKEKLPSNIENSYKSIKINSLRGSITINEPTITIKDKDSGYVTSELFLDKIEVNNISYLDFYFDKQINIGNILLDGLKANYFKRQAKPKEKDTIKKKPFNNSISVRKFKIKNSSVTVYDETRDSILFITNNLNVEIKKLQIDSTASLKTFKNNYKTASIETDSLFFKAGSYENLNISHLILSDHSVSLEGIQFKTKYSKAELSKISKTERDHINLNVDKLNVNHFEFGGLENDSLFISTNLITIDQANAKIFRDKLVADDLRIKPLYSKTIRELPFKLTVDSVSVSKSNVVYSEKTSIENPEGVLTISSINAGITNVSNTYLATKRTEIIVDATFMKNTPIHFNWNFDVNKTNDSFKLTGEAGNLQAAEMNAYLSPLINIKLEGKISKSFFTITGDFNQSEIKLSQNYTNIKLDILNKKKTKNKFLSSVANILIHTDSEEKEGSYFHNITTQATRDKTKSFFNYLAKNLIAGLIINFTHKNNAVTKPKKNKKKGKKKRTHKN